MRVEDLHPDLRHEYTEEKGWGVQKIPAEGYENIPFVIPRSLPRSMEEMKTLPQAELREALSRAFSAINSQKDLSEMDGIDQLISRLIHRQEALSSSRIEGTFSTIDELFSAESDLRDKVPDLQKPDALSILGYAKVMDLIFDRIKVQKEKGITVSLFQEIHKSIVSSDPSYYAVPGEFRKMGEPGGIVQIGGIRRKEESIYNPAPPIHVGWLMDAFVGWLSDEDIREEGDAGLGIPLPIRMTLAHGHFEAIHPFPDGNGRVGRLIWPIQMIMSGIAPIHISGFIEAEKEGYYEGLKAYQQKLNLLPLLKYLSDALASSKLEEEKTRKALKELPAIWQARVRPRKGSSAEKLMPLLLSLPVISAEEASRELGVTLAAAISGLERLNEEGVIEEITGRQRRKKWSAHEVLTILKRPYGLSPQDALKLSKASKKSSYEQK